MMRSINSFIIKHKYFLILLGLVTLFAVVPLLILPTTRGHDIFFHLERIESLSEEFKLGNFFPRIYSSALDGAGYASPMFYGDLFLSIPALLVVLGMSVRSAYTAFQIITVYALASTTYFSCYSMTKDKKIALCGGVMFTLCSYFCTDLVQRAAVGEVQAFVFLPLVFLGYYHIMFGENKKWYFLPIGMLGMLAAHTLTSVMAAVMLGIMTLCFVKRIIKRPKRLLLLVISALTFLLVAADFIAPMLEQMKSTSFLSTDGYAATKWGKLSDRTLSGFELFSDFNISKNNSYWIPNGIGFSLPLLAVLYAAAWKKYKDKLGLFLLCFSFVLLFMTSSYFPWDVVQDYVGVIQFPWRLLMFVTFFCVMSAVRWASKVKHNKTLSYMTVLIVFFSLVSYFATGTPTFENLHKGRNDPNRTYGYNNNIGAAEYLPTTDAFSKTESYSYNSRYAGAILNSADKVYSDGSLQAAFTRENGRLTVRFIGSEKQDAYIDVPLVMYKGYTAVLYRGDEIAGEGESLECFYGVYNRVRVTIGDATDGIIVFEYTGTKIQKISRVISFISFNLLLGYLIYLRITRKKQREKTLYVTDLDGTLFNENSVISEKALSLLNNETDKGKNITVATARTPATLHEKLSGLKLKYPVVVMNGGAVYDMNEKKYLWTNPICEDSTAMLAEIGNDCPGTMMYTIQNDILTVYYKESKGEAMDSFMAEREGEYKHFVKCDCLIKATQGKQVVDFCIITKEIDAKRIYDKIKNLPLISAWYCNYSVDGLSFVEANAFDTSKGGMVRKIMKAHGFNTLVAFGDNRNDRSLIEAAELGVAPDNATVDLKCRAALILPDHKSDSVAEFIAGTDI